MFAILSIVVIGLAAGLIAFDDDIKSALAADQTTQTAETTEKAETTETAEIAENKSPAEETEIAAVAPEEEKELPNPFEPKPEEDDGYYFVVEDAEGDIQEGDEVVAELDDEEIQQILSFTFDRSETDQHADFLVERILASFSEIENVRLDPGDPEFDTSVLQLSGPTEKSETKKPPKKKKKTATKKKKTTSKKTRRKAQKEEQTENDQKGRGEEEKTEEEDPKKEQNRSDRQSDPGRILGTSRLHATIPVAMFSANLQIKRESDVWTL